MTPSEILAAHGVDDTRAVIRDFSRHGFGIAPTDAITDLPDLAQGDMVDDPDREDDGGVLLDMTRALHPEALHTAKVDGTPDGVDVVAMVVRGRINQSDRRVSIALLVHRDAAVLMIESLCRFADVFDSWADAMSTLGLDDEKPDDG